jgi:uncharacterized protein (DUF58 family)
VRTLTVGAHRSAYRGPGDEIVGTRPYRPGDRLGTIDWNASARLGTATAQDVFVVREHAADVAVRAVVVLDRRPSNGLFPPGLPWLSKPAAAREAAAAIATSVDAVHGATGFLEVSAGRIGWQPPRPGARTPSRPPRFDAAADGLERSLAQLRRARVEAPAGTFVFVCSDFLAPPPAATWRRALAEGWDVVPVVVQDPLWERSFPAVGGLLLPVVDPEGEHVAGVRLTRREATARRVANERRFREVLAGFAALRLDAVVVDSAEPARVDAAFHAWAAARRIARR